MIRRLVVFLGTVSVVASVTFTSAANAQNPAPAASGTAAVPNTAVPNVAALGGLQANPVQSALQQQEEKLLDQMALLKTDDPNYQEQMQSIGAQLRDVQAQMQEMMVQNPAANPNGAGPNAAEFNAGNLNQIPVNPLAAQGTGPAMTMPQAGDAPNPMVNPMPNPAANPGMTNFNPQVMPNPAQFTANGMGAAALANPAAGAGQNLMNPNAVPAGEFNPAAQAGLQGGIPGGIQGNYDPMTDPILLKQIKEELSFQLKQIQQTKSMLGLQDQALANTLTDQQNELLRQLKDVNEKLGEPADSLPNDAAQDPAANTASGLNASDLNAGIPSADDYAAKVAKIHQAATLLQEAGLMDLANRALNQAAALGTGNFDGTGADQDNWFSDNGVKRDDIDDLRASMTLLKEQVTTMTASLEEVQTQLKLLSRQMAAAPASSPAQAPASESAAEPANPEANAE